MIESNGSTIGTATPTANPIYLAFKDAGVSAPLVSLITCKAFVCLIGIFLNLDLIIVTWRSKNLRGACNLQIAINALSISIQQSSSFVTLAVVATGTNFIHLGLCGILQALPLFCTIFTNGMAFSIGVDRLLSVLFPVWYLKKDKRSPYLTCILVICSVYALIVPIVGIKISLENATIPVMCTVIDPVQKEATWVVIMLLSVNMASVCCYAVVWIAMTSKKSKKKHRNIFKSLSMILALEFCGWITNYSMRLILGAASITDLSTWYIVNISTIAPYLSMTLSPLTLYAFSKEYRRAFIHQFPCAISTRIVPNITNANGGTGKAAIKSSLSQCSMLVSQQQKGHQPTNGNFQQERNELTPVEQLSRDRL